jgi:hypothetical protein
VAVVAGGLGVSVVQGKDIVGILHVLPPGDRMAVGTGIGEALMYLGPPVDIVLGPFVTIDTEARWLHYPACPVAIVTGGPLMAIHQRKEIMIELGSCPANGGVTISTLVGKRIVLGMAGIGLASIAVVTL